MQAITVNRAEAGQKLLQFLLRRVEANQGELHRWLRSGQVRRNMGRAKAFDRVEEGDAIRVPPFAKLRSLHQEQLAVSTPHLTPTPFPSFPDAVYEDENLLVIAKAAGLPSQNGTGHSDSIASRLAAHYAGAAYVPAPAHRLDRDSSGLILAGKSYRAQRALADAFARQGAELTKDYLAWVWGAWDQPGVIELGDSLKKDEVTGKMVCREDGEGQDARSLVACLRSTQVNDKRASLLLIRLLTGRTHQIRVQLASRGFPLPGDPRYGKREQDKRGLAPGLLLHACHVVIPPPFGREFALLPPWKGVWAVDELPDFHKIFRKKENKG